MARLPIPGSDDGTWGDILNEYLAVSHDTVGAIKADAVDASAIQDNSITNTQLATGSGTNGQVLTKNDAISAGFEWTSAAGSPDATTTTKGIVQLAGDLTGTATAPAVAAGAITGAKIANTTITDANISASAAIAQSKVSNLTTDLAAKVPTSRQINAGTGLSGGGDLSTDRTLTVSYGTTAGTAAQGNDSRITEAVQATTVDAKGDILAATAADTVTRLAVGTNGQVLTADSAEATGIKWATPSGGATNDAKSVYPLSAYGFYTASNDINLCLEQGTLDQSFFTRVFIPAGKAITALGTFIHAAGTVGGGGLNGFAVYDNSGTLVTSTTDDNTMWQTTGWVIKVLSSSIAAQGSDRFVYIGISSRGYTVAPSIPYSIYGASGLTQGGGYLVTGGRRSFYNGLSSWPASFDPTTYGTDPGGYLPLVAVAA